MPLPIFTPPMRPSPGTTTTPELSLRKSSFGDGYEQRSPAGLNHVRRTVNLEWPYLNLSEAKEIEAFLVARGGYEPFIYRLNGETVDRRWTCETWAVTDDHPSKVTAQFREWFGVAT